MEHLWAPWRNAYLQGGKQDLSQLFTTIGMSSDDEANLVVYRSKSCYAVLNRFPYNTGHMLVIPYRAVNHLNLLGEQDLVDLWTTVQKMSNLISETFKCDGLNIGMNIGTAAGAGIPEHIHVHIVPRWTGDTNFMASTLDTRVHPNDLETVYRRLKQALVAAI